jgi:hypothetical protein
MAGIEVLFLSRQDIDSLELGLQDVLDAVGVCHGHPVSTGDWRSLRHHQRHFHYLDAHRRRDRHRCKVSRL